MKMTTLDRILYGSSIISLIAFTALFIIALWFRFESETLAKIVGSIFVLFAASFLWLVIRRVP